MPDFQQLVGQVVESVKGLVARSIAGVSARVDSLEQKLNALPVPRDGERGEKGEKGDAGPKGDAGESIKGEKGDKGDAGPKGDAGESIKGEKGEKGDKGDVGPQGEPGLNGKDGAAGVDGKDGAHGEKGEKGDKGDAGEKGDVGPAGPQGEKGEPGIAGKDGADGKDGAAGLNGKDGADGRDALAIEPTDGIDTAKSYPRNHWAFYRGGMIRTHRATDPVGDEGILKAGWSVAVEGVHARKETQSEDGRYIDVTTEFTSGKRVTVRHKSLAVIYRGVYKQGADYLIGDTVTWGGSVWHADVDHPKSAPGIPGSEEWHLIVKRGDRGKDGKDGAKGEPGKNGKDAVYTR